jgi:trehalose 2-sulfotransferase
MMGRHNLADRGYAICTSRRSGSNLLCQYLASTGVLGNPREYFNGSGRRMLESPGYPDDPTEQIKWILTEGATPNRIYGLKVFPAQADRVEQSVCWFELLPNLRFVTLKRRDVLAQAISAVRAMQTNQWRASMPSQGVAVYDGAGIYAGLAQISHDHFRWKTLFAQRGVEPLALIYEDLVKDPQISIDRIASFFDLSVGARIDAGKIDFAIQRDAVTEEWRARFIHEYGEDGVEAIQDQPRTGPTERLR